MVIIIKYQEVRNTDQWEGDGWRTEWKGFHDVRRGKERTLDGVSKISISGGIDSVKIDLTTEGLD